MSGNIDDPNHWYDRAAEMRRLAGMMKDPEAERRMRKLADEYDGLGDRSAERAKKGVRLVGKRNETSGDGGQTTPQQSP